MAGIAVVVFLALFVTSQACLLPPHGCKKETCDNYYDMIIPPNNGDFGKVTTWQGNGYYQKLAFIRSAFNKLLGPRGPSRFNASSWLALEYGYYGSDGSGVGQGPPTLPSLNYEFYDLGPSSNFSEVKDSVTAPDGTTYKGSASLFDCCHACRVTFGCPMYAFVPYGAERDQTSKAGGKCYFVYSGADDRDGPFDFVDGTDQFSPRTNLLKAPQALSRSDTRLKLAKPTLFPSYYQLFLGGYCNPWKYPNGTVTDDPHFTGAHGTKFDFNGELNKAFCLLTDRHLTINAVLKGYKSDAHGEASSSAGKATRSWIKELGFIWIDGKGQQHTLHLHARTGKQQARGSGFLAGVSFDGNAIQIPEADRAFKAADLTFTFLGTTKKGWYDVDMFQVAIGQKLDLAFNMRAAHPKLQTREDAEVHFNLMINDVRLTDKVHGVLGQTYRNSPQQLVKAIKFSELNRLLGGPVEADGESGAGFLEGSVTDYEASHVLKPDCKASTYHV